jgi:SAM-dependent methyltransferase
MSKMNWDQSYAHQGAVWGAQPSELALFACEYMRGLQAHNKFEIADLGCGYGRDTLHLAKAFGCSVLGIDNSTKAISMARESCPSELSSRVQYRCADFNDADKPYPVIFVSNLYQVLPSFERARLIQSIKKYLRPDGVLLLSTLSTHDPEEYGRGVSVAGEDNSFEREKFLHFSTRAELEKEFAFLNIERLFEHDYLEPHAGTRTHHHISWILAATKPQN